MEPDFSGWATKNGLKCSDGRTIMGGAFKHQDKMKVPLVWGHQHNDIDQVLGHAILENRNEGVYTYGFFNDSEKGKSAREAVKHGDVGSLSIYANKLREENKNVLHGDIKEVSLVLAGANPGAVIDNVYIRHGDEVSTLEGEAIIYTEEALVLHHSDGGNEAEEKELDTQEVLNSLTEDQKTVVHGLLEAALTHNTEDPENLQVQTDFEALTEEQQQVVHSLIGEALEHSSTSIEGVTVTTNLQHAGAAGTQTVQEVVDSMSPEQQKVLYFLIEKGVEKATAGAPAAAAHSDEDTKALIHTAIQEGLENMSRNVFEQNNKNKGASEATLSHDQLSTILEDAKKNGSLKDSFLSHAVSYGIEDIDILFPDAQSITSAPDVIGRRTEWVAAVLGNSKHSPFSRIKSTAVDLTADEARAKGYVKGNLKKEEVIKLLKRVTTPTTVYKKQKLDRDDIIDITDLDVVSWLKAEMRVMLDEEIARAILIGDGREADDEDKINEDHLRPIAWDDEMYSHSVTVPSNVSGDALVESILRARKYYKGTGTPSLYTTDDILTDLILLKDKIGRRQYNTEAELAAALRVDKIIVVEVMESTPDILGIIVNIADYTIGADKGGQVSMFDDFDIDYNQQKYLIETRISGCLTKPKSAVVVKRTSGTTVTPTAPAFDQATNTLTIPSITGVEYYDVTSTTGTDTLLTAGNKTITETTDVEARPATGYNFPHNTDADWTYPYTA